MHPIMALTSNKMAKTKNKLRHTISLAQEIYFD